MSPPELSQADAAALLQALKAASGHARDRAAGKRSLRETRAANAALTHPSEEALARLDSSIKKNGTLVKKLKVLTDATVDAVIGDVNKTNQGKFLGEAAVAVAEAAVKPARIPALLRVITILHGRYEEFSGLLLDAISRPLQPKNLQDNDKDSVLCRRACLKLLVDLELTGIASTSEIICAPLQLLGSTNFKAASTVPEIALSQLTTFVRVAREDMLDLVDESPNGGLPEGSPPLQELVTSTNDDIAQAAKELQEAVAELSSEMKQRYVVPKTQRGVLLSTVERAFKSASRALVELHNELMETEQSNSSIVIFRGALPPDLQATYEASRKQYESLMDAVVVLANASSFPMPKLAKLSVIRMAGSIGTENDTSGADTEQPLWDDDHVQAFYESLPELTALVPGLLLSRGKDSSKSDAPGRTTSETDTLKASPSGDHSETNGDAGPSSTAGCESDEAVAAAIQEATDAAERHRSRVKSTSSASATAVASNTDNKAEGDSKPDGDSKAGVADDGAARPGADGLDGNVESMRSILDLLPKCQSREAADELTVNFCFIQTKGKRKALARAMTNMFQLQLQLIPFYARITASLSRQFPDIGVQVCETVLNEFNTFVRQKDATQRSLEPRTRNARYVVELVKFRVLDPGSYFVCLRSLLDDFSFHNIDTACELVIGAGSFFMRQATTLTRMENMLEIMMRLKGAKNLDNAKSLLVDSAAFACRPADVRALKDRKRTPLQRYIRHLVFDGLADDAATMAEILKDVRRLPWRECEPYVGRCLLKAAVKGRFEQVQLVASLLSSLSRYRDSLIVMVIDMLLEEIRQGLETPSAGSYQRRIAYVRFLGECYNYRLIKSQHLFFVLYLLISFGHDSSESMMQLDPPDDTFRIKLVMAVLSTTGRFFSKGTARRKLDRFLVFLQRYTLAKEELPPELSFSLTELLTRLRPNGTRFTGYEDAHEAVLAWQKEEAEAGGVVDDQANDGAESSGDDEDTEVVAGDEDESGLADGEEEEVVLGQSWLAAQQQQVDELYEKELAALMPVQVSQTVAAAANPFAHPTSSSRHAPASTEEFRVRLKRGGKDVVSHSVQLPSNTRITERLHTVRAHEAAERTELKKLVLAAEMTQMAEELGQDTHSGQAGRGRGRKYSTSRSSMKMGQAAYDKPSSSSKHKGKGSMTL